MLPGVGRVYIDDDSWQAVVTALLKRSRAILVQLSDSEGLLWELNEIIDTKALDKTILLNIHPDTTSLTKFEKKRIQKNLPREFRDILSEDVEDYLYAFCKSPENPKIHHKWPHKQDLRV
ncbi:hypothetical protein [Parvularcula sp. IMCC14364]|uniref:hypothetical protein n=1 Tax=Parvularcula sp. IMCC14364 TaxID=3067902 RepID=UPI0027422A7C|nr:hypothetical protein [Parvularcula sp. IMCC14364]